MSALSTVADRLRLRPACPALDIRGVLVRADAHYVVGGPVPVGWVDCHFSVRVRLAGDEHVLPATPTVLQSLVHTSDLAQLRSLCVLWPAQRLPDAATVLSPAEVREVRRHAGCTFIPLPDLLRAPDPDLLAQRAAQASLTRLWEDACHADRQATEAATHAAPGRAALAALLSGLILHGALLSPALRAPLGDAALDAARTVASGLVLLAVTLLRYPAPLPAFRRWASRHRTRRTGPGGPPVARPSRSRFGTYDLAWLDVGPPSPQTAPEPLPAPDPRARVRAEGLARSLDTLRRAEADLRAVQAAAPDDPTLQARTDELLRRARDAQAPSRADLHRTVDQLERDIQTELHYLRALHEDSHD